MKRGETIAEFQYSDSGDKLTQQLIGREFDYIYWGKSEEAVLRRGKAFLAAHFGAERLKTLSMLDLGCGMGRLIPEFAALTGDVTGLEPDRERCQMAADFLRDRGVENARVHHMDLGTYLDSLPELPHFDVVLCSHIFQHFSHATFAGILRDLQRCTGKETVFLFTTTFAPTEDNQYTFERFDGGVRTVTPTDPEGFERAVEEPETLAVCLFSRHWMTEFLAKGGLRITDFAAYHFQNEHDAERDPADNEDPEKLKEARDAFYICLPFEEGRAGEEQAHIPVAAGKISFMQFYNLGKGTLTCPPPGRRRPLKSRTPGGTGSYRISKRRRTSFTAAICTSRPGAFSSRTAR